MVVSFLCIQDSADLLMLQASFKPKLYQWSLDKLLLAPWYKSMFALGTWTWEQTRLRNKRQSEAGDPDFMRALMQANDQKCGLSFSEKELWLEVFMMAAIGMSTSKS